MGNLSTFALNARKWKIAYRAAIFCRSRGEALGLRISDAEEAIVARTRELFTQRGAEVEVEREALEDALYALRALRTVSDQRVRAA